MDLLKPLTGWYNLLIFVPLYFSMGVLLKTFFTPWKRYYWKRKKRGLHIDELFYVAVSNILSRAIGVGLRIIVLAIGGIATISALIFGLPMALVISLFSPDSFIFHKEEFSSHRGIAWDWHYGYTPTVDEYSQELYYKKLDVPLTGRSDEMESVARVLVSDREKNLLLVGEPGSGRRALLTNLSHEMATYRFLFFDWIQYFKGIAEKSQQAAKLEDALFEVRHAGNVVLILPDIHELISYANVFEQYLERTDLHIVGLTTPDKYHADIFPSKSFMKHFVTIDVNPLSKVHVLEILAKSVSKSDYEELLSPEVLEAIYNASMRLESTEQKHQPEAALGLLSEFETYIKQKRKKKDKKVASHSMQQSQPDSTHHYLELFIEERLEIPFGALSGTEKETLKHLEKRLHERIVNQREAIGEISGSLRRRQLQLSSEKKPIGSFLFLGPTGVGKTETAKALADIFFEDEKKLIRFDMAQYQSEKQMEDLTAELAKAIRETPYAILLLDEIEKANKKILNLFLSIVDEGYFFDENRSKVLCNNLIIIGTSNAASEFIREQLTQRNNETMKQSSNEQLAQHVIDYVLKEHVFSPEFINRFDATVVYTPLSKEHLREIAEMKLEIIKTRLQSKHKKTFSISSSMIDHIVEEGSHPEFGARELDRTIRKLVEEPLAERLLE